MPSSPFLAPLLAPLLAPFLAGLLAAPAPARAAELRPPAQNEQRLEALDPDYRAGLEALGARRLDDAERLFRAALTRRPNNELAEIGLADVAWARGQRDRAGEHLARAVSLAPTQLRPAHAWVLYLLQTGRAPEALEGYRALIARFPNEIGLRSEFGALLLGMGDPAGEQLLREVVQRLPTAIEPRIVLVQHALRQNRPDDARREAVALTAAVPGDGRAHVVLGQVEAARGDWRAALAAFDRAVEVAPRFAVAHMGRGEILMSRGETALATVAFERAIEIEPANLAPRLMRAAALERGGQVQPAERAYLEVIERDPNNFPALNNLAFLSAEHRRNLDRAEGWARRALELAPQAMEPRSTLGWVLRARGDLAGAAREMEQATRMAENRAQLWAQLATIYLELNRRADARAAAERALAIEPANARAREVAQRAG